MAAVFDFIRAATTSAGSSLPTFASASFRAERRSAASSETSPNESRYRR
ncbi:hypothetical protein [Bradyrhizobium sp. KBS0727]